MYIFYYIMYINVLMYIYINIFRSIGAALLQALESNFNLSDIGMTFL